MSELASSQSTRFLRAVPVLAAQDLAVSLEFYANLGFPTRFEVDGYAGFTIGDEGSGEVEVHLWHCEDRNIAENTGCRVEVANIQPLYEKCQAAGAVHINGSLQERPWGTREFVLVDPAGNIITFFELRGFVKGNQ